MIDSNAVTSIFGKTNSVTKLLAEAVKDEAAGKFSMLYWNKKEATSLLQQAGLQLPGLLMPRDGFIHSIRESASPVKVKFDDVTESQQFKRLFGDWKNHPNTASKVVNADGQRVRSAAADCRLCRHGVRLSAGGEVPQVELRRGHRRGYPQGRYAGLCAAVHSH